MILYRHYGKQAQALREQHDSTYWKSDSGRKERKGVRVRLRPELHRLCSFFQVSSW